MFCLSVFFLIFQLNRIGVHSFLLFIFYLLHFGTLREETHVAHTIAPAVQDPKAGNHSILYSDHTTDDTFQELEQPQNARKIENSGEQGITNEQANSGNLLSETNMAIKDKACHDRVMQEIRRMEEAMLYEVRQM